MLPTFFGDTGLWFLPTADVLASGHGSVSVFRANFDRRQGLTDVSDLGITGAWGIGDKFEVFGSWRMVRLRRDVRNPLFQPADPERGGVDSEFPFLRRGWSKNLGGPTTVGAKWSLISQSRGDAMSLAPRIALEFPSGSPWASTNKIVTHADIVASRELHNSVELTSMAGAVFPQKSDVFTLSDRIEWGLGAIMPTRSPLRALVEYTGEWMISQNTAVLKPPFVAEDGSIAPLLSPIHDAAYLKFGAVWQSKRGMFVHGGVNYSQDTGSQMVNGRDVHNQAWGWDVRVGFHPGVKVYVPPPPPAPEIREVIREVPAPAVAAPPPPPANRPPTFNGPIQANPGVVQPGGTSNLSAPATDADGDALTYTWTTTCGTFTTQNGQNTIWTAPNMPADCLLTATVRDNRGGVATSSITIPVIRREALVFDDVHFDFDRSTLKPEAIRILDDAVMKLQANPGLTVTIEGHTDSVGTAEYNLSLGERRANAVRDYLLNRGIAASRLRTVSYGEERPKADNNTDAGRAINRRASIVTMTIQ